MKISVKTDPETLFLIHKIVLDQCQMVAHNIGRKSNKSMRIELFTQLSKRCISYSENPNGKPMQISFKYHLAALLYDLIIDPFLPKLGVYEANKIEIFKNTLHRLL